MAKKKQRPARSPIQQAVGIARRTSLLPTSLNAKQTAALARNLRRRVFWSARTTKAEYLKGIQELVVRHIKGEGYENDLPQLRIEARRRLDTFGYTPEKGFKGDAKLGIPSATPGSLRDLSSEQRLNLIFRTQADLARGLGQHLRGLARMSIAPAYELLRGQTREMPRDWQERWIIAGDAVNWVGVYATDEGIWIARKTSPIWRALGSRELFEDALDVEYTPYAINSGMIRVERSNADLVGLRLVNDRRKLPPQDQEDTDAPVSDIEVEQLPTEEEAIDAMPETQEPEEETAPDYVDYSSFIGGKATVDRLLENLHERAAAWKASRGLE